MVHLFRKVSSILKKKSKATDGVPPPKLTPFDVMKLVFTFVIRVLLIVTVMLGIVLAIAIIAFLITK